MRTSIITEIINNWDPINLFPCAPEDEYEVEIQLILELSEQSTDRSYIAKGIKEIFIRMFGEDIFKNSYEECLKIADEILKTK